MVDHFRVQRVGLFFGTLLCSLLWNGAAFGQTASDDRPKAEAGVPSEPTPGQTPESAPAQTSAPGAETKPAETGVWDLVKEGKRRLKEKDAQGAIEKLRQALAMTGDEALADEDRALVHYLICLAAQRAQDTAAAISAIQQAIAGAPKEADYHLELGQLLFSEERNQEAKAAAQEALRLGLSSPDDRKDAEELVRKAKRAMLHERLTFDLSATVGYDSNVMQGGQAETIGGVPTGVKQGTASREAFLEQLRQRNKELLLGLMGNYKEAIEKNFAAPVASIAEWDIPVTIGIDLGGRLYGNAKTEVFTGYRFTQIAMTSPSADHDAYSLQEHVIPLRLQWQATPWLLFRPKIEGFANFTGLKTFSPFQGGLNAGLDFLFLEGRRWRTRFLTTYQLRRSFDRDYSYLDGHRVDAKLMQEVRINGGGSVSLRGYLWYRFRADLSGVLDQQVDLQILSPRGETVVVGTYDYHSPLSFLGHEVGSRWRLYVPKGFEFNLGGSIDFRNYREDTTASYTAIPFPVACPNTGTLPNCPAGSVVTVPRDSNTALPLAASRRRDMLFSVDFGILKTLPAGFSLDATVAFSRNASNIGNGIDNRNYSKLTTLLSVYYSF